VCSGGLVEDGGGDVGGDGVVVEEGWGKSEESEALREGLWLEDKTC